MPRTRRALLVTLACLPLGLAGCLDTDDTDGSSDTGVADAGPTCELTPPSCGADLGAELPVSLSGSTVESTDDYVSSCVRGQTGPDEVYTWTAPEAGVYAISLAGSSYDTVLTILDGGCSGAELTCNDDMEPRVTQSALEVQLEACQRIGIVVDGFDDRGDYTLSIERLNIEFCGDGVDNDGDGLVDCDDEDCDPAVCLELGEWPAVWTEYEAEVLRLTNERREAGATCGAYESTPQTTYDPMGPLEYDKFLTLSSRRHSEDMARNEFFDHVTPEGVDPFTRMAEAGFTGGSPMGENIAAGQSSPEEVVQGWMDSPGHCHNIMTADFGVLGVGYFELDGSPYRTYWTQNFGGSHGAE